MGCMVSCDRGLNQAQYSWNHWNRSAHLGVSSWAYDRLGDAIAIPILRFSGTLALFDVPMSYGRYWVTVSLDSTSPERDNAEDE